MPACSPAPTRLQNSESKYSGYLRNACDSAVPVSTSPLMSVNSRATELLAVPLATMSKACSSGTPARIITDSWRVNSVMSFSVIFLPFL
jgi:hypothetical protein